VFLVTQVHLTFQFLGPLSFVRFPLRSGGDRFKDRSLIYLISIF